MSRRIAALLALALVPLTAPPAALGGPSLGADAHVHLEDFAFSPKTVPILVGETIEWDNHDLVPHTVTADDGSFDSGDMNNGDVYTRTFSAVATIPYHCDFHPSMLGTIVVSDPNALPDLVVSGLSFVDNIPGVQKVVNVTVRNLGNAAAGASNASAAYVYQGEEHLIGEFDVDILGPGASATGFLNWNTLLKVGDFAVRARADANGHVVEADEGNNLGEATTAVLVSGLPGIDLLDPV